MDKTHPSTTIKVTSKAPLSSTHIHVLSLLYQPIIGKEANALYLTLHALLERSHMKSSLYPHAFFYDMLDMNEKSLTRARQRLEAAGLMESYISDSGYLFELYLPLSAEGFIKDSPFCPYLRQKVGSDRFKDLTAHFKITRPALSRYKNISVRFDEIFDPLVKPVETRDDHVCEKTGKPVFNEKIDVDLVLTALPDSVVTPKLKTRRFKDKLEELAYLYQLKESDLQKILLKSIDKNRNLDFDVFTRHAQNHYQKSGTGSIRKKTGTYSLDYFKEVHPRTFLEETTGSKAAASELRVIERLITESGLSHEVINVLVAYVLKELDNTFPVYNFFDKVAAEWKRNDVTTAEDAVAHIQKRKQKQKEKSQRRPYTKKEKPVDTKVDWFDDYLKDKDR